LDAKVMPKINSKIVQLEADIAAAPQLVEADFADVAARGFRSVVNIRPDGEAPDQLPSGEAKRAAERQGLTFRHLPVMSLNVTDDDVVDDFARLMEALPGPILFYCGSATRCTTLWTQAAAPRIGIDAALAVAREAGHDLDFLRETIEERIDWLNDTPARASATLAQSAAG
jgi:sulfide:quinone oxidoreductase